MDVWMAYKCLYVMCCAVHQVQQKNNMDKGCLDVIARYYLKDGGYLKTFSYYFYGLQQPY